MKNILSFNSLRFFGALFIVWHHIYCNLGGVYFHQARFAVELFFILSGFLLAKSYERAESEDLLPVVICQNYFFRRFLRLWPEYIFAALLSFLLLVALGNKNGVQQN